MNALNKYAKYLLIIFVIFLSILSGCKNIEKNFGKSIEIQNSLEIVGKKYVFENKKNIQTVYIKKENNDSIEFTIISKNKTTNATRSLNGIAKLKSGDVELDEDSDGLAYPVNEYIYKENELWVYFRLDIKTKTILSIKSNEKKNQECPFNSIDKLHLKL